MLTPERLGALAQLTLTEPQAGAREVMALNPPLALRWTALLAASVTAVVLAYLPPALAGNLANLPAPFLLLAIQLAANLLAVWMLSAGGRMFGGTGRFEDALLLLAWLQLLMVAVQAAQLLLALVIPPLAVIFMLVAVGLFFWILTDFVRALHGFSSRGMVMLGIVGGMFAATFVIVILLNLLGIDPLGMSDV